MRFLFSAVREYSFDGNSKTPKWTSKRERERESSRDANARCFGAICVESI